MTMPLPEEVGGVPTEKMKKKKVNLDNLLKELRKELRKPPVKPSQKHVNKYKCPKHRRRNKKLEE